METKEIIYASPKSERIDKFLQNELSDYQEQIFKI